MGTTPGRHRSSQMPIASLHNVTTHYGAQPVLTGASFDINPGQKLGLIGPNGSARRPF